MAQDYSYAQTETRLSILLEEDQRVAGRNAFSKDKSKGLLKANAMTNQSHNKSSLHRDPKLMLIRGQISCIFKTSNSCFQF